MNAISKYKKEVITAVVFVLCALVVFCVVRATAYYEQVTSEKADAEVAENYMQNTSTDSTYSVVLGSSDTESSENYPLTWTGQMGISIVGAEWYDSIEDVTAFYPQLNISESSDNPGCSYLICKLSLENISAASRNQLTPNVFNASIFKLIANEGENFEDATQALADVTNFVLFDGTCDLSDIKGFYNFELEPGQTKVFTCGYACMPEAKTMLDGASDTFGIAINTDGMAPAAILDIPPLS
jgi:hypothetical protein